MSIVDFTFLDYFVLALDEEGSLIVWDLSPQILASQNIRDYPLIGSSIECKVLEQGAVCILKGQSQIFICGQHEIKVVQLAEMEKFIKKSAGNQMKCELPFKTFRQEQGIQSSVLLSITDSGDQMIDQSKQNRKGNFQQDNQRSCLIYTTKTGKIYSLSGQFAFSLLICDVPSKDSQQYHSIGWNESITSMIPYRENTLLLAGTSAGRILIVSLILKKVVEDVTAKNGLKLPPISSLKMSSGGHRFYSAHENCVAEWSMQLQKCLGYFSYTSPYSILQTQKISFESPKILIAGGSRFIQIIDSENPQHRSQIETNLQSVHLMKQFNNKIYCGGRHGMIEIFQMGISNLILFKNNDDLVV